MMVALLFSGCEVVPQQKILISAADQKMAIYRDGVPIRTFRVSTSKFGLGDRPGSYATPLGLLRVKKKIGDNVKEGTVFKGREPTREVLSVDAPGRDPIVTRILWLEGLEDANKNAFKRYIYIHGTPEERNIGRPVSYGCIRMRSHDIVELFDDTELNTRIFITSRPLPKNTAMGDRQAPLSQSRKFSKVE
ncbi:MAG: L,D-transpeptidase [Verrucomicrobia bacterium]|nr:L,D-transpeptidase [Verrucomicrobiota bacterium]